MNRALQSVRRRLVSDVAKITQKWRSADFKLHSKRLALGVRLLDRALPVPSELLLTPRLFAVQITVGDKLVPGRGPASSVADHAVLMHNADVTTHVDWLLPKH